MAPSKRLQQPLVASSRAMPPPTPPPRRRGQYKTCSKWTRPARGSLKLNVDGSRDEDGISGCGGIIRDYDGNFIKAFSYHTGYTDTTDEAELLAILYGMKFLDEEEIVKLVDERGRVQRKTRVTIESDSQNCIRLLRHMPSRISDRSIRNLVKQCNGLMNGLSIGRQSLTWVRRSGNKPAHKLADIGRLLNWEEKMHHISEPPEIRWVLTKDREEMVEGYSGLLARNQVATDQR